MITQQAILAQAKQGEPDAIAALMNRTLQPQGAQVQIKRRGNDYKILISSAQVPDQAQQVKWIVQGLNKLAIPDIQTVTIYGKAQQSPQPNWQQQVHFPLVQAQANASPEQADADGAKEMAEPKSEAAEPSVQPVDPSVDLSEYCFTRNKSLVSVSLDPPADAVCQVIFAFAALPDEQKLVLLPHCQKLFRRPEPIEDEALSEESQTVAATMAAVEGNDLRKLSIWLSRYCAHPAKTVDELTPRVFEPDPEPEISEPEDLTEPAGGSSHRSVGGAGASPQQFAASSSQRLPAEEPVMFAAGRFPVWLVPTIWAVGLAIAIALGIRSIDTTAYAYPLCDISPASGEICTLAVQVLGGDEDELSYAASVSTFLEVTEEMSAQATEECSYLGYLQTADFERWDDPTLRENFKSIEITDSQIHTLFKGVVLTDLSQRNLEAPAASPVRVACVSRAYFESDTPISADHYDALYGPTSDWDLPPTGLGLVALDTIPSDWPETVYKELPDDVRVPAQALGIYDVFITFGAGTIFSAVGIFVAVLLCPCYRCRTISGVYQMAGVLGFVEALMRMVPGFGFLTSLPMDVIAIGLASRFVKDFHVDWQQGFYGSMRLRGGLAILNTPVGRGAFLIIAIRQVLSWGLYGVILHLLT
ncbi:MAG: hypothetical protein AAFR58_11495 [Cyanobacteria bacterium J06627_28]